MALRKNVSERMSQWLMAQGNLCLGRSDFWHIPELEELEEWSCNRPCVHEFANSNEFSRLVREFEGSK